MRFFFLTEAPDRLEGEWQPPPELARHLKALRLAGDERFLLLLPLGGALLALWDGRRTVRLAGLTEIPRLPLLPVTLATAWPKGSRADQLVVRATEAGVERIIPLLSERGVAGQEEMPAARLQRWQKLARETCEQCGRPFAPLIDPVPVTLEGVREEAPLALPVALVPGQWALSLELSLKHPKEVLLLVGPEGGFSPGERRWLQQNDVHQAGLLPTTLRVESAGPLAVAICQHWFQEMRER